MCGIAGIIDFNNPISPEALGSMLKLIVHRGPDDEGRYDQGPCTMGMRRLSIIDLDGGHQPICNEDGSLWVVFNGEIYNYVELRSELRDRGHVFKTQTDTEVLVHLYEEYGDDFPKKLNGMYGFALWDARRQRMLLARDHLGIKPLYWSCVNQRLIFASELKCLPAAGMLRTVNHEAIAAYLHLGYIPRHQSPFVDAHKLPPGCMLVFDRETDPKVTSYWRLSDAYGRRHEVGANEAAEEVRSIMKDAVRLQLRSDVPVGTFLSGGIDSSSITALAAGLVPRLDTFGVGFEGHYYDETVFARMVAKHCGTHHHEKQINPATIIDHLGTIAGYMDEPNSDPALLPSYLICKYARDHVKVVLSGNGGDEVFGGYPRHLDAPVVLSGADRGRLIIPSSLRKWMRSQLTNRNDASRLRRLLTDMDVIGMSYWVEQAMPPMADEVSPWAMESFQILEWIEKIYDEASGMDWVNRRLYYDSTTYMPDQILNMLDRASMAVSLEVRVPLLDIRLVEYMAGMAGAPKIRGGGSGKDILKLAMRNELPDEIFTRRKLGFGMPMVNWIDDGPIKTLLRELPQGAIARAGFINGKSLSRWLERTEVVKSHWPYIWNLVMLELWHKQHAG